MDVANTALPAVAMANTAFPVAEENTALPVAVANRALPAAAADVALSNTVLAVVAMAVANTALAADVALANTALSAVAVVDTFLHEVAVIVVNIVMLYGKCCCNALFINQTFLQKSANVHPFGYRLVYDLVGWLRIRPCDQSL